MTPESPLSPRSLRPRNPRPAHRLLPVALLALVTLVLAPERAVAKGGDDSEVLQFLASTGADADGTAKARWRDKGGGVLDFSVELEQLDAGTYDLFVADANKGSISVDGTGQGEIEFKTPLDSPKPLFDFEVFGQVLEVRQGATVFFSDTFEGSSSGGGGGGGSGNDKTKTELSMVNTGLDFNAKGTLKYQTKGGKSSGEVKFTVEVERLDAGTYTLLVGGPPVAEIISSSGSETEVEFQDPVEPGKVLLNFDPLGQQVDIALGPDVYLSAFLPASDAATGTKSPNTKKQTAKDLGKGKGDKLLVVLANTGVAPGAQGKATLAKEGESEFEVEIEDVPSGDYGLFVGGLERGTLSAGSGSAQLDFSSSPGAGQLLLDFEVQGALVEVRNGSGETLLASVFPVSVQAALGSFKQELVKSNKLKLNLVNVGADLDATGTLQWKLAGNGNARLELRVKDLPAGTYGIFHTDGMAGAPSAAQLVVAPNGKGKLVLASAPKGSQAELDFDPLGLTIEILGDGDTTFLAVEVPNPTP